MPRCLRGRCTVVCIFRFCHNARVVLNQHLLSTKFTDLPMAHKGEQVQAGLAAYLHACPQRKLNFRCCIGISLSFSIFSLCSHTGITSKLAIMYGVCHKNGPYFDVDDNLSDKHVNSSRLARVDRAQASLNLISSDLVSIRITR